jgi:hypothetical protein
MRYRPSSSLKNKLRETVVGSRRKRHRLASEKTSLVERHFFISQNPQGENGRTKSLEEISRSSESR